MKLHLLIPMALSSLVAASVGQAALNFRVTTDTSKLIGSPAGPFSLDFQFIDGSGLADANNTVTLSNFDFGAGSWTGSDPGPISLSDTAFFSEFYQAFTPGNLLRFDVSLTMALDSGPTPDEFSFAILDGGWLEIPTHGLGDALLSVDLDSAHPPVATFSSDLGRTSIDIPAPIVTLITVPETGVPAGLIAGVWTAFFLLRHRSTSRAAASIG